MTAKPARVFDMFTSLPTPERVALEIRSWGREAGYRKMFGERWSGLLGLQPGTVDWVADLPQKDFLAVASERLRTELPPAEHFVERLRDAGVRRAVIHGPLPVDVPAPDELTSALVERFPAFLVGFARVDLRDGGAAAAAALEDSVVRLGLRGATYTPFWHATPASDSALAPVLETAQRLGVPIWIHTSMHWRREVPLDVEHPRHIDEIAGKYPDLTIICGHGGWPWMPDMVAVAWRHPNVYIDVSAFRPRNIFKAGSGWEALVQYGEKVISEKILIGTTWALLGTEPATIVDEAAAAPWPEAVRDRWMYSNAERLLG